MRSYKFRVWDSYQKRFLLHEEVRCIPLGFLEDEHCPRIVEQYIEKEDKKGQEIACGDLLKVINHFIEIGDGINKTYEARLYLVVWDSRRAAFMGKLIYSEWCNHKYYQPDFLPDAFHELDGMGSDVDIVGNMRENPEMLIGKDD